MVFIDVGGEEPGEVVEVIAVFVPFDVEHAVVERTHDVGFVVFGDGRAVHRGFEGDVDGSLLADFQQSIVVPDGFGEDAGFTRFGDAGDLAFPRGGAEKAINGNSDLDFGIFGEAGEIDR